MPFIIVSVLWLSFDRLPNLAPLPAARIIAFNLPLFKRFQE